jgi:uncharacterized membrane protein YebE (DUF533 family)
MSDSALAMSTWIGTLEKSGVLDAGHARAGAALAAFVVGEERLDELRAWFRSQPPEIAVREKKAAIEICIWMANADRHLAPAEAHMLRAIVRESGLDADAQAELTRSIDDLPSLHHIERRLTHETLRELLLALAWELASADGTVHALERDFHVGLARRLGVEDARAAEIRAAIAAEVESGLVP